MCKSFSADDYSHYIFTPKDLTRWTLGLLRYNLHGGASQPDILQVWENEAKRIFIDKLAGAESVEKMNRYLAEILNTDWGVDSSKHQGKNILPITYIQITVSSPRRAYLRQYASVCPGYLIHSTHCNQCFIIKHTVCFIMFT